MASLIGNIIRSYNKFIEEDKYADPRTKDYFLVSNPLTVVTITLAYLYFCTSLGPRLMKDRQLYELKTVIQLYNVSQIFCSLYVGTAGAIIYYTKLNWLCEPLRCEDTPFNRRLLELCNMYYLLKLSELVETVFFVLRKKFNQITFLHLFHHTLMFLASWLGMRYCTLGHSTVFGIINSYVHVVMYSYYLIASLGPQYQKYLWWKKYMTLFQMIQFVIVLIHNVIPLFTNCGFPKIMNLMTIVGASIFIYMFGDFYIKTYMIAPKNKKRA